MAVTGGDISATAMPDEAGQRKTTADLQDALADPYRAQGQLCGQIGPGRPQQSEQRPCRRGDTPLAGLAVRIAILLPVEQGTDDEIRDTRDGDMFMLGTVGWRRLRRQQRAQRRRAGSRSRQRQATATTAALR